MDIHIFHERILYQYIYAYYTNSREKSWMSQNKIYIFVSQNNYLSSYNQSQLKFSN